MAFKRILDVTCAAAGLIAAAPLLLGAALAIILTMGPPVLFRQRRPGLGGRPFTLFKLRTMTAATDAAGERRPEFMRVTALGRWLRRTSIDELPQLWNVLKGEMSLVGPRPLLLEYLERYDARQMRRHEVRPGITGWTQVHRRTAFTWAERLELDVWYVDHHTTALDLLILARTVKELFSSRATDPSMDSLSRTTANELEFRGGSGAAVHPAPAEAQSHHR